LWKADRRARKGAEQANSRDDQFDRNRWTSGPPWCLDQMMHQDGDSAEMNDLFDGIGLLDPPRENMAEGAVLLRGAALPVEAGLLAALADIVRVSPFRHMVTPGGYTMSVAMTNCGAVGWVTDRGGYRYGRTDPRTGNPWPLMPSCFLGLAAAAAAAAGYPGFDPDACLINRYEPGARLLLHQDKDELSFDDPIVSVSLGLPATFQFGGLKRKDPVKKYGLSHGDIAVWGGPSRLCYHGIAALKDGCHEILGRTRINLTFRRALGHGIQPIRKE
jgi:alkylated DNA repair protein (DNA oxidative demethylase)